MALDECGTGISQVLAILYVITQSETSQTIIIDEPQSFLHPGAVRKLIEVLKEYSQHQFIIATHSPTVISATEPATIVSVTRTLSESELTAINPNEAQQLRFCLEDIGVRPSDVFGADNILWVEGRTEEVCFPKIIEKILKRPLSGTVIKGVRHTGDLSKKHAIAALEIYESLCQSSSLLPPALGFLLDDDGRSEEQKQELKNRSRSPVHFTQRRMFENYLLHPGAIAWLINKLEIDRQIAIDAETVNKWLQGKECAEEYCDKKRLETWCSKVDGATLLTNLFSELTETKEDYDGKKVSFGAELTEWIIENDPQHFRELAEELNAILNPD